MNVLDAFVESNLCKSKKEAKRMVVERSLKLNGVKLEDLDLSFFNFGEKLVAGIHLSHNHFFIHGSAFEDKEGKIIRIGEENECNRI